MPGRPLFPILVLAALAAGCGESPRRKYYPPIEGQSPPAPPAPIVDNTVPKDVLPDSAAAVSPAYLRANAPVEWTTPSGWEEEISTKPMRLVEFTLEKNGPGGAPVQFLILNGADDHPAARPASITRWQTFFHEDIASQSTDPDHDGLKIHRMKVHGTYEGPPSIGNSELINEPNWTMICGWVEGQNGSIMFRVQGPDAIIKANEAKIDQLLASMRPRTPKQP